MTKLLSTYAAALTVCVLSTSAYAERTTINITGTVRAPTCSAVTVNNGRAVSFGEVDARNLRAEGFTTGIPFDITLVNCNTQTYRTAVFKFTANTVTNSSGYQIALVESVNHAKGVAITVKDSQGRDIKFNNQDTFNYPLNNGNNKLMFDAFLVSTGNNWDTLTPGLIAAQATFTVSYI
jgi:type 1 fimbria pilin